MITVAKLTSWFVSSFSAAVELEYSLDLGLTWQPLIRDCLPTSPDCSSYTLQRLLVSDTYNKWGRVTLPIPSYARLVFKQFNSSNSFFHTNK